MTLEFDTPDALYAHYQAVAHRIGSRRYVYPIVPIAVGVPPRVIAVPEPAPIVPLAAEPTPEEFWEKMEALNYPRSRRIAQRMVEIIAKKYGLTYEDITGPRRFATIIFARQEAYWWLHRKFKLSAPLTSSLIGNRDHTCVLQGVKKHEERMANAK